MLGVSQLLPHKRQETLIQAVHLLQWCHGLDIGLVLVGAGRSPAYEQCLRDLVRGLRVESTWLAGRQSDRGLATIYRRASVFANPSEHEGLGIPPLEAMAFAVPTIVRDAGASAETVGDGALVLPDDAGPALFAEAIHRLVVDADLRGRLVAAGSRRIGELNGRAEGGALAGLIERDVIAA